MKGEKLAFITWIVCIIAIGAILGSVFGKSPTPTAEVTPGQIIIDDYYAPGTVLLSEVFSPEESITISRPHLSPELEELVGKEGLYCCLAYTQRGESATAAALILSKDPIGLSIWENVLGYVNVSTVDSDLCYSMSSASGNVDSVSKKLFYADGGREYINDELSSTTFIYKEGAYTDEAIIDFGSKLSTRYSYTFSPEMAKYSATEYLASKLEVETLKMLMMQPLG